MKTREETIRKRQEAGATALRWVGQGLRGAGQAVHWVAEGLADWSEKGSRQLAEKAGKTNENTEETK